MWVLDARYKAEKVWYSIIWEKAKEDPNVIDYNINEEITKDTSAVFNANNDTTTGMANVIPWVNAPKLIAQTSILWIDFNAGYLWWVRYRFSNWPSVTIPVWESVAVLVTTIRDVTNKRWPYEFKRLEWKWIVIPSQWTYELACTYAREGSGWMYAKVEAILWWSVVHTSANITWETTETFNIDATKWQWLIFRMIFTNTSTSAQVGKPIVWVTITKK